MAHIHGQNQCRNSSKNTRQKLRCAAKTTDGIAFVYYPQSNRGIWYEGTGKDLGVGILGPNELKALAEIVSETGHF
jgi:hypothetical protein